VIRYTPAIVHVFIPALLSCVATPTELDPHTGLDTTVDIPPEADAAVEVLPAAEPVEALPDTERLCQLALTCDTMPAFDTRVACTLRVAAEGGRVDWDGDAQVWIRGRSSSSVAKPGYGVELPEPTDLLGMGGERDWVIDGLYYDRLLVRDKLGYDLLSAMGGWAPESALCELTLNGAYFGVHALVERIERDDDRLDIADGSASGDAFVVTQNDSECLHTNTTTYGCRKLVSPDDGNLTADARVALEAWFVDWEASIVAGEPVSTYIDVDSAVDAVLIEEFFKNEDAFYTSMHAWKDEGGTLGFVPWDLDMTFGQFPYYPYGDYANVHAWIEYRPLLWTTIAADPEFHARLAERWAEVRAGPFATDAVLARLDALEAILGDAIVRNDEVWPIEQINYGGWFYEVDSYADEDAHVREWATERLIWMDANIGAY
jgi:hypothetical protein